MKLIYGFSALFFILSSCSTPSTHPEWANLPTRQVDNGYIVYVGTGQAQSLERAQFKAEGIALEDLANECSMIPKGTRIEDRASETASRELTAYVKIGVEFQNCEEAKKTIQPDEIKKIANVPLTEQLKRYQDYAETGEIAQASEHPEYTAQEQVPEPPARAAGTSENVHFYVTRQYVAYQKEVVVLSPPTAYAPQSPETKNFTNAVAPVTQQLQTTAAQNPELTKQPQAWSQIHDRPPLERPSSLTQNIKAKKDQSDSPPAETKPHPRKSRGSHSSHGKKTSKPPKKSKKKPLGH